MDQDSLPAPPSPIRGAIRALISNSTDNIATGSPFSIFVTIQNPFEVPITINQISAHIPTELVDIDQYSRVKRLDKILQAMNELYEVGREVGVAAPPGPDGAQKKRPWFLRFGTDPEFGDRDATRTVVAREIGTGGLDPAVKARLARVSSYKTKKEIPGADDDKKQSIKAQIEKDLSDFEEDAETIGKDKKVVRELQPGNSTTRVFTLRTHSRVWLRPSTYRLKIEIEYEIDKVINFDTVEHILPMKSSFWSVIFGSVIGAAGGWAVKEFSDRPGEVFDWPAFLRLITSCVLAAMVVVLFSRKKDVQPLVAVEDFWGGMAIGFIAAYAGTGILNDLLPNSGAETIPEPALKILPGKLGFGKIGPCC